MTALTLDLTVLLERLRRIVREEVRAELLALRRLPYHQGNLPPGETKRSYLDKAARGDIATSKTGRTVLCEPAEWERFVASRIRDHGPARKDKPANDTATSLREHENLSILAKAEPRRRRG